METVLLYIGGVLVIALGIAISIALHELGHFIPARAFGVKVGQFMVGFGPTIFSRRRGETEYGVKAIPFGGYISMAGMYPPASPDERPRTASTGFMQTLVQDAREVGAETAVDVPENRLFYRLPIWKRIVIMLGGPFVNLLIGIVLYAVVLCGIGVATDTGVGNVSACVLPASSERQECEPTDPEAPGAAAGILPGDSLVSVDGVDIRTFAQLTEIIQQSPGIDLDLVVERDGELVDLVATPRLTERYVLESNGEVAEDAAGNPVSVEVGFLGISPAIEFGRQPITAVLPAVGDNIAAVARIIANLPQRLFDVAQAAFGTAERDPNGPISVVGVGRVAGEISSSDTIPVEQRVSALVGVLASLNIALFVFNLIPLMPLDGGHVAGALFEGIRRFFAKLFGRKDPGPVDIARFVPLTLVVVVVLGLMSALLIYADIVKPISFL